MITCGRPVRKQTDDDDIPCGTRLWWGVGTDVRTLEIVVCNRCLQKQKAEEQALEEATCPQ